MKLPKYRIEDGHGKYFSHMIYQDGSYHPVLTTLIQQASIFLNVSDASDICKIFPDLKIVTHD